MAGLFSRIVNNQWLDFYYCDAIPSDVVMVRGRKKNNANNNRRSLHESEIISDGSIFVVNEGQTAITVENGRVTGVFSDPGEHEFHSERSTSVFSGGGKGAISTELERELTGGKQVEQRIYYMNMLELKDNFFSSSGGLPVRLVNTDQGLDADALIRFSGRYTIRVKDPELLYKNVIGNISDRYYVSTLVGQLNTELMTVISTTVSQMTLEGLRPFEIPSIFPELTNRIWDNVKEGAFSNRGIYLVSIGFNYLNVAPAYASDLRQAGIAQALLSDMDKSNPLLAGSRDDNPLISGGQGGNPLLPDANKKNPFL